MKYITRELYQAIQVPGPEVDQEWKKQCEARQRHIDSIFPSLPVGARYLAENTLHDGVIRAATRSATEVILVVDAASNPWGPRGCYQITFRDVLSVSGLDSIVGDEWLYEEIDLHADAAFQFNVLLVFSELEVVADAVDVAEALSPG